MLSSRPAEARLMLSSRLAEARLVLSVRQAEARLMLSVRHPLQFQLGLKCLPIPETAPYRFFLLCFHKTP